jgi:DNA-binding transcriptional regulator YdaS (Cro superfamily)
MLTKTAIKYFGSQAEISRRLEISSAAVAKWGDTVPEGSAYKIESISGGQLKVDPEFYRKLKQRNAAA